MAADVRAESSLSQRIFDDLCAQIIEGVHAPGSRMSMESIKNQFGVSKQPIMDALRRLETIGLVEIEPRSGCKVRVYSMNETRDFFHVFAAFEGKIAAVASMRHTPDEVNDLDEALARLHEVEQTSDFTRRGREYFERNAKFHGVIHTMSRSPLVAELSRRMWYLSDFLMYRHAGAATIATSVMHRNHDHELIRMAIADRNDAVAKAAMEHHIRSIVALF